VEPHSYHGSIRYRIRYSASRAGSSAKHVRHKQHIPTCLNAIRSPTSQILRLEQLTRLRLNSVSTVPTTTNAPTIAVLPTSTADERFSSIPPNIVASECFRAATAAAVAESICPDDSGERSGDLCYAAAVAAERGECHWGWEEEGLGLCPAVNEESHHSCLCIHPRR
jgi:hypothetical protein